MKSSTADVLTEIKETVEPFFEENFSLSNAIYEFSLGNTGSLDSKIVKSYDDVSRIRKWITNGSARFKLLYRGTRDGFTTANFQKKCGTYKPTITIVKSNYDKVFGGFTDQDWSNTSNYKVSTNVFLFSVTNKKKYALKANNSMYATYTNPGYLPTFGGGFDFYCCEGCDKNTTSYCNFPYSYEANGDTKETFAGAYNFSVKEIEVFHVEYSGDLLVDGADKKSKVSKSKPNKIKEPKVEEPLPDDYDCDGGGLFGDEY